MAETGKESPTELLEQLFQPADGVTAKPVDDVVMIVNARDGNCFELNQPGALVWKALERGEPAAQALGAIARGSVSEVQVRHDVETLIAELLKAKLLRSRPSVRK